MKVRSKFALILMIFLVLSGSLSGCASDIVGNPDAPFVYFLNFKPEAAKAWEKLGSAYHLETGVAVRVVTAAAGTYEQRLAASFKEENPPTLFQVNGRRGYEKWQDYCLDLQDTDLHGWLIDQDTAISGADGGVYAIPYVLEGYGIIYNQEITDAYFALEGAVVSSMEAVTDFETLKGLVEDMSSKAKSLGIDGVFASTSFAPGEDWRWQTHLFNLPLYYEYQAAGVSELKAITFQYNQNYKNIFDLYIAHSPTDPLDLGNKTVMDSVEEFAKGQVAMFQDGNWAWSQLVALGGGRLEAEQIKMLPIYTGVTGEKSKGICIGTENYFCINAQVSKANQEATLDFLEWVFHSESGKKIVSEDLGFISPFSTFTEKDHPSDPLTGQVIDYLNDETLTPVPWVFSTMPSQAYKNELGANLLSYAQGQLPWEAVVEKAIDLWSSEYQN